MLRDADRTRRTVYKMSSSGEIGLRELGLDRPSRTRKRDRRVAEALLVSLAKLVSDARDQSGALDLLADSLPHLTLTIGIEDDAWALGRCGLVAIDRLCELVGESPAAGLIGKSAWDDPNEGLARARLLATCFVSTEKVPESVLLEVACSVIEESGPGQVAGELLALLAVLLHPERRSVRVMAYFAPNA